MNIHRPRHRSALLFLVLLTPLETLGAQAVSAPPVEGRPLALEEITVTRPRVANLRPAIGFASGITALRFDPQVDLQSRGAPEGQADITVQGGIFENTGVKLGAVTLMDPQTGHYFAELPIPPVMLTPARILTGTDNALAGLNSTVATVDFDLSPLESHRELSVGGGDHGLNFQQLNLGGRLGEVAGRELAGGFAYDRSQGNGKLAFSDHRFQRFAGRLQFNGDGRQTDLVYGYQDKFFGWPGAYTGFASLPETDHTRTRLLLINHRSSGARGWLEAGAYYRDLRDDYDFDRRTRESGGPGSFDHRTRVVGTGVQGREDFRQWSLNYAAQIAADRLVSSTDLTAGNFDSRRYYAAAVVPERTWQLGGGQFLRLHGGLRIDDSNRDAFALLPMVGADYEHSDTAGVESVSLTYSSASQVPGYTALNSRPTGLFGGNASLGRERSETVELRLTVNRSAWHGSAILFHRHDNDLTDWTYSAQSTSVRQANAVDLNVDGLQLLAGWVAGPLELSGGYGYLEKDADYGSAAVDASYYALNFPRHRITVAATYHAGEALTMRVDGEWRRQQRNLLRSSDRDAQLVSASLTWTPPVEGLAFSLIADNLLDDKFQEFPGTPPAPRRVAVRASWTW